MENVELLCFHGYLITALDTFISSTPNTFPGPSAEATGSFPTVNVASLLFKHRRCHLSSNILSNKRLVVDDTLQVSRDVGCWNQHAPIVSRRKGAMPQLHDAKRTPPPGLV